MRRRERERARTPTQVCRPRHVPWPTRRSSLQQQEPSRLCALGPDASQDAAGSGARFPRVERGPPSRAESERAPSRCRARPARARLRQRRTRPAAARARQGCALGPAASQGCCWLRRCPRRTRPSPSARSLERASAEARAPHARARPTRRSSPAAARARQSCVPWVPTPARMLPSPTPAPPRRTRPPVARSRQRAPTDAVRHPHALGRRVASSPAAAAAKAVPWVATPASVLWPRGLAASCAPTPLSRGDGSLSWSTEDIEPRVGTVLGKRVVARMTLGALQSRQQQQRDGEETSAQRVGVGDVW